MKRGFVVLEPADIWKPKIIVSNRLIFSFQTPDLKLLLKLYYSIVIKKTRQSSCAKSKRHTARRVASTPSAVLSLGVPHPAGWGLAIPSGQGIPHPGSGVPHPGWVGTPFLAGRVPHPWSGDSNPYCGIPYPDLARGIPHPWLGVPHTGIPHLGLGYPLEGTWDQSLGYPPGRNLGPVTGVPQKGTCDQWKYYGMEMGYPTSKQTDACENITSHCTTYAGSNNMTAAFVELVTTFYLCVCYF